MKKTNILTFYLLFTLFLGATQLTARSSYLGYSQEYQIDQDLDLNAVASLFGDSRNLDDFERRLNDPYYQMSNLDLNNDGYVDYLRVLETVDGNYHFITIQAVIGHRRYQDIATLEVYRSYGQTHIQLVGNTYIYGPNYIIEPLYSYTPQIFTLFWQPRHYHVYHSPYRWRAYPSYYRPWRPVPTPHYHRHIRNHINHAHSYRYTRHRRAIQHRRMHKRIHRNDYAQRYPNRSYTHRKSHKKRMITTDTRKNNIKKINRRALHKSNTQRKRTAYRPISRSHTQKRTDRNKVHTKKHIQKRRRPTDRHVKRERIQKRSISAEGRIY
jgi:hypothetical protein